MSTAKVRGSGIPCRRRPPDRARLAIARRAGSAIPAAQIAGAGRIGRLLRFGEAAVVEQSVSEVVVATGLAEIAGGGREIGLDPFP